MTHHLPVEAVSSLMLRVDDILSENPPAPGAESHLVTLLHGKEMTLLLAQIIGSLKPHIHTTHEETIYVLRGSGQALVGGSGRICRRERSCISRIKRFTPSRRRREIRLFSSAISFPE